jgi:uncharacterized membrane protein
MSEAGEGTEDQALERRDAGQGLEPVVGEVAEVLEELGVPAGSAPEAAEHILAISENTRGPFPPPAMLQAYEQTLPGMADRIVVMAEKSLEAEPADVRAIGRDRREVIKQRGRGQLLSVAITAVVLVAACIFFATGNNTAGIAFLGSDVILVSIALAGGYVSFPQRGRWDAEDEGDDD